MWDNVAHQIAQVAATPLPSEILIGLRVLTVLGVIIVINAQIRSWRWCNMTAGRWMTVTGWLLVGIGLGMSALMTSQLDTNTPAYQLIVLVGLMLRLSADVANAGKRRAVRRKRRERMCRRDK
ncbi:hypothetical protein [Deinococcus radiophilus]